MRYPTVLLLTLALAACHRAGGPDATPPTGSGSGAGVTGLWRASLEGVATPDRPVAGTLAGQPFAPDRVEYDAANHRLSLLEGAGDMPARMLVLELFRDVSGPLAVDPGGVGLRPQVHAWWTGASDRREGDAFASGYSLRLELAPARDGARRGRIYLCLPDGRRSAVCGTFSATTAAD